MGYHKNRLEVEMSDTAKDFIQKYKNDLDMLKKERDKAYTYLTNIENSARKASNIARDQLIMFKAGLQTLDTSIFRLESMISEFEQAHKREL